MKVRNVIFSVLFLLAMGLNYAQSPEDLLGDQRLTAHALTGPVKSVELIRYSVTMNNGIITPQNPNQYLENRTFKFNAKGWLTEEVLKTSDGTPDLRIVHEYDQNNNRTAEKRTELNHNSSSQEVFRFNSENQMVKRQMYDEDGQLMNDIEYTYESSKLVKEEGKYKGNGDWKPSFTITYKYDADGDLIQRHQKHYTEEHEGKEVYAYDAAGNRIEEKYYHNGELEGRSVFTRDTRGNILTHRHYSPEDILQYAVEYKYDSQDRQIEESRYDEKESLLYTDWRQYDLSGNVFMEAGYNGQGQKRWGRNYRYNYDAHGNWIERLTYENDRLQEKTERLVTYY